MPKKWRVLLSLLSAAILIALVWRSPPKELKEFLGGANDKPRFPSSYLIGSHTTQFTDQGTISYTLAAKTLRNFESNQNQQPEITLDQPVFTLFKEAVDGKASPPWVISSNYGEGSEKLDELLLTGDVVLLQTRGQGLISKLITSKLLIKPKQRYAETDKPVMITDPAGVTRATGLKIFFDDERIELLSDVKGQYIPQQ